MNIVITGSTRGIGLGMAQEFLKRSHNVMISSRNLNAVNKTVVDLRARYPSQSIAGSPVDVSDYDQVQRLWDESIKALKTVDMWVNNAGTDT
ncbi:MAG: SDR family NAD(P)-dependent oxidoreductase, partial [Gammaproteobacteria bacterium]